MTRLTIDRVVLTNVSLAPREADAFRASVQRELQELFTGDTPPLEQSREHVAVSLSNGAPLARSVAAAIHSAIGKGR